MKNQRFDVLSPDGISIHHDDTYPSEAAALKAAKKWVKRFAQQGYYSSPKFGRIPMDDIIDYCSIVEVDEVVG